MNPIIARSHDFQKLIFLNCTDKNFSGKLIAHYELYKKISHIEGSIINCGVAAEESFNRFASLRNLISINAAHKMVAFEKFTKSLFFNNSEEENPLQYKVNRTIIDIKQINQKLLQKGLTEQIDFRPGYPGDSIPEYLIENPELKIAYLNIDFDDYESTLTALQFLYPRIVEGGMIVLDNYYKKEEDFKAISDYFRFTRVKISSYSVNMGPHYIVIG